MVNRAVGPLLRMAVAQTDPTVGDIQGNVEEVLAAVRRGVESGVDVLVLPELCNSGYVADRSTALRDGEPVNGGVMTSAVLRELNDSHLLVVLGLCETDGAQVFDSAVALTSGGLLGTYRKTHLWGGERAVFDAGDRATVVLETPFGRMGMLVCFDIWFPETVRLLAELDTDFIAVPSNWDLTEDRYFDDGMRVDVVAVQAHINEVVIACADRSGQDEGFVFAGRSVICEPRGVLAGPASIESPDWITADVDVQRARGLRSADGQGHLQSRRHDLYSLTGSSKRPLTTTTQGKGSL